MSCAAGADVDVNVDFDWLRRVVLPRAQVSVSEDDGIPLMVSREALAGATLRLPPGVGVAPDSAAVGVPAPAVVAAPPNFSLTPTDADVADVVHSTVDAATAPRKRPRTKVRGVLVALGEGVTGKASVGLVTQAEAKALGLPAAAACSVQLHSQ